MGFVKNFRRGFATNSSSSHSFVYMKKPQTDYDTRVDTDFGWNDFRLDTVKQKLMYVLTDRLYRGWSTNTADPKEAMEIHGADFPELDEQDFQDALAGYVDHESSGLIGLDQARDPHVVVFGGNDNSGASRLRGEAFDEIDWSATDISSAEYEAGTDEKAREAKKAALREASAPQAQPRTQNKFHISKDGTARACRAVKNPCPYSAEDHFPTREAAVEAVEKRNASF